MGTKKEEILEDVRADVELLHKLAENIAELDGIEQAEEEGLELFPMMAIGRCIHSARTKCLDFDAYFVEKYGRKEEA